MRKFREEERDGCIFGNIVLGAVTLPRGCTRRLTLSVRLNVYVPSTILPLVAPYTSKLSLSLSAIPTAENPSRRSLNHTLFVSRRPCSTQSAQEKGVHRARKPTLRGLGVIQVIRPASLSPPCPQSQFYTATITDRSLIHFAGNINQSHSDLFTSSTGCIR